MNRWYAIRCTCGDCSTWLVRQKDIDPGHAAYPLLVVFAFGEEENRLIFTNKEIADALAAVVVMARTCNDPVEVVPIDPIPNRDPGILYG